MPHLAASGLKSGALKPVVGQSFPLSRAGDAHIEIIEHTQGTAGKIVLLPWEDGEQSSSETQPVL